MNIQNFKLLRKNIEIGKNLKYAYWIVIRYPFSKMISITKPDTRVQISNR